jgi:WD40 repeat protein
VVEDGRVTFRDVDRIGALGVLQLRNAESVVVSPDAGSVFITTSDGDSPVIHWTPPQKPGDRGTFLSLSLPFSAGVVDVSPDSKRVLVVDRSSAEVSVFDLERNKKISVLKGRGPFVRRSLFDDAGKLVAAGFSNGQFVVWDWENDKDIIAAKFKWNVSKTIFSEGRVAALDRRGTMRYWDLASGQEKSASVPDSARTDVSELAFCKTRIAVAQQDGRIKLYATNSNTVGWWKGHTGPATCVVCDPRKEPADNLASIGWDGTLRIGSVAADGTSVRVVEGPDGPLRAARFTSDGKRIVTASEDGIVRIWNIEFLDFGRAAAMSNADLLAYAEDRVPLDLTPSARAEMIRAALATAKK